MVALCAGSCFSPNHEKLPQKVHSGGESTAWHELEKGQAGLGQITQPGFHFHTSPRVCVCSTCVQMQRKAAVRRTQPNSRLIGFELFERWLTFGVWAEWSVAQRVMRRVLAACTDPCDHVVKGKLYKSANTMSGLRLPLVSHTQAVIHCLLSSHQQVSIVEKVHFTLVCWRVQM